MNRAEAIPPTFRCGRCNKPFDKEATFKRHGYYCRSRREGLPSRMRSCTSCAKRKARCDNQRPACSGCIAKNIQCTYPAVKSQSSKTDTPSNTPTDPPTNTTSPATDTSDFLPNPQSDPEPLNHQDLLPVWDDLGVEFDFNAPLTYQGNSDGELAPFSWISDKSQSHHHPISFTPKMTIPTPPAFFLPGIIQRPVEELGIQKQRTAKLVFQTLKSYPLMLLRHDTLPPFIHPRFVSLGDDDEKTEMEPLNNCISLLHMLGSRVAGSRRLFWRNVKMECDRFQQKHLEFSRWETLFAMQALFMYVTMRLDEGQNAADPSVDLPLVAATMLIAQRLNAFPPIQRDDGTSSLWEDWVFEESRRRLCVVFTIFNMLAYFQPSAICEVHDTGFAIAPLPARRRLWDASDEIRWRLEKEKDTSQGQTVVALATSGELIEVNRAEITRCGPPIKLHNTAESGPYLHNKVGWDEWCSGMDGLGGLVMMASALVEAETEHH